MAPKTIIPAGGALRIFGLALLVTARLSHAQNFSTECATQSQTCGTDDTCVDCFDIIETGVTDAACLDRYENADATFCERIGASYCCLFEDDDAINTCLGNSPTVEFWGCVFERIGCSIDDLPCYGHEDSSSVGSGGATTAPVAAGTGVGSDGSTTAPAGDTTGDSSTRLVNGSSATAAPDVPATTSVGSTSDTTTTDPPEEPIGREVDTPAPTTIGSAGVAGTPTPTSTGSAGGSAGGTTSAPVAGSRDIVVSPSSSPTSATTSLSDDEAGSGAGDVTPSPAGDGSGDPTPTPSIVGDEANEEVGASANVAAAGITPASGIMYAGVLGLGVLLAAGTIVV